MRTRRRGHQGWRAVALQRIGGQIAGNPHLDRGAFYATNRSSIVTRIRRPDRGVMSMRKRQRPAIPSTGMSAPYRPPAEALSEAV